MPIARMEKTYRGLPITTVKRIKLLKTLLGADNAGAVIGMGIARLEGNVGCTSCGANIGENALTPPPVSSPRWEELKHRHAEGCRWIKTKGFQIKIKRR